MNSIVRVRRACKNIKDMNVCGSNPACRVFTRGSTTTCTNALYRCVSGNKFLRRKVNFVCSQLTQDECSATPGKFLTFGENRLVGKRPLNRVFCHGSREGCTVSAFGEAMCHWNACSKKCEKNTKAVTFQLYTPTVTCSKGGVPTAKCSNPMMEMFQLSYRVRETKCTVVCI